jgi:hypothetical protein
VLGFLRAHPIVCLLLLSPGIPEYLSSSSPMNAIILNPFMFLFQLTANLGLYGPGVLLIREARIRWKKGWGSVLILGAAYGILEEGVALSTLYNQQAQPVGQLGYYGHWLGVNWVWAAGIIPVHMIFSISLPILLLGLALPETEGRSLLSRRGIPVAFFVLGSDVLALMAIIARAANFWMGWTILISSLFVVGLLVLLAHKVHSGIIAAKTGAPRLRPRWMGAAGALFYLGVLLVEGLGMGAGIPAGVDFGLVIVYQGLFLLFFLRVIGSLENTRNLLAFSFGLIIPIAAIGVAAEIALPMTLLPDLAMVLFFRSLWRRRGS